jgi:hypothetical protein
MRDVSRLCRWILVAIIGLVVLGRVAWAEIPPSAYARMRDAAGEVLQIEVLKVDGKIRRGEDQESQLTVTAKVVCMVRSASGLTPGATITIGYSTVLKHSWGWAGPAPIGILRPGVYTAYLDKSEAIYTPAAQGQSFIANKPDAQPSPAGKPC